MATHPPLVPGVNPSLAQNRQRYRRNRRGEFAIWWREIDRVLLTLILSVMAIGTAAVAAASPASARRLSTAAAHLDDLHFFVLHLRWQMIGLIVMLGASCLPKYVARRAGIDLGAAALLGLMLVPVIVS